MSKILDLLNYSRRKEAGKNEKRNPDSPENFGADIREKLADTYIFNPANASEHVIKKQHKQAIRKHSREQSTLVFRQLFPWLISFLAILLLLVNIAYRGKISINIEILDENTKQIPSGASEKNPFPARDFTSEIKPANTAPISTFVIVEGYANSYIIKRVGFYGAAANRSRIIKDGLYLFNDGTTGWASAGIDFIEPMNLSNATLDFFVKGVKGNESLKLTLRDNETNSYMPQASNIIFNKNMGTDWQFVSVPFIGFDGAYNPKKISHIGLEFGTQTASNETGSSLYIQKIKIVKNDTSP